MNSELATGTAPRSTAEDAALPALRCSAVLTHHWLVRMRGGEKVLQALCELLPGSPIYTLVHDPAGVDPATLAASDQASTPPLVITSFLQRVPGAAQRYPKLLPLMPLAYRRMKLPRVDLVLCSDAAIAKAMTPAADSRVVCYCHSPPRYVWEPAIRRSYQATLPAPLRPLFGLSANLVRRADARAARRVDQFVANSRHVTERIRRFYGRDSVVVYPPVDLPPAPFGGPRDDFYLCVGHHVPYKRLDLAVAACRRLGRRLVVIGDGPDVPRFARRNDPAIEFLGVQPDEVLHDHYRRARALLFPGEEDFGIVPVEAMAHGCPVIAYGVGGATETVTDGETGVLFAEQTVAAFCDAIRRAEDITFDPTEMHARMQRFRRSRFLREMHALLASVLDS